MLVSVEGKLQNGKIELTETPPGVAEGAKAIVTFLDERDSLADEAQRLKAVERLLASMEEGLPIGGPPYPTREELHERR